MRSRGDEQANDGDIGTVPVAVDAKKAKVGAAAANSSESGRIGAHPSCAMAYLSAPKPRDAAQNQPKGCCAKNHSLRI